MRERGGERERETDRETERQSRQPAECIKIDLDIAS